MLTVQDQAEGSQGLAVSARGRRVSRKDGGNFNQDGEGPGYERRARAASARGGDDQALGKECEGLGHCTGTPRDSGL